MRTKYLLIAGLAFLGCKRTEHEDEVKKPVEYQTPSVTPTAGVDRDMEAQHVDLEGERSALSREIQERTAELDKKIDALEKRGDDKAKDLVATLRAKRDQARAKLAEMRDATRDNWTSFKEAVSKTWDDLEHDVNDALD